MPDIVLATLNAKYIHASLGLRYLYANLGELRERATLAEFTLDQRAPDIAERLLALQPSVLGLGVYIWNVAETAHLVAILKQVAPQLIIVLGGPEVSHEQGEQHAAHRGSRQKSAEGLGSEREIAAVDGDRGAKRAYVMWEPFVTLALQEPAEVSGQRGGDLEHRGACLRRGAGSAAPLSSTMPSGPRPAKQPPQGFSGAPRGWTWRLMVLSPSS